MNSETAVDTWLEAGLATLGIEADEAERSVMKGVWSIYQPGLELLLGPDLDRVPPERDLDLSRPPTR